MIEVGYEGQLEIQKNASSVFEVARKL